MSQYLALISCKISNDENSTKNYIIAKAQNGKGDEFPDHTNTLVHEILQHLLTVAIIKCTSKFKYLIRIFILNTEEIEENRQQTEGAGNHSGWWDSVINKFKTIIRSKWCPQKVCRHITMLL